MYFAHLCTRFLEYCALTLLQKSSFSCRVQIGLEMIGSPFRVCVWWHVIHPKKTEACVHMLACWFVPFFGFIEFDCRIFPGTLQDELWRSAVRYLANDTKGELFGKGESCICVAVCAIQVICYSFFYCCCGCCCHYCCLPCRLTCQFKVHLAHISLATCWFEPPGLGKKTFLLQALATERGEQKIIRSQ